MPSAEFIDLYEILQVSPNAEKDTIKRVHQILSLKYQLAAPENNLGGWFAQLQQAAATLLDNEARAAYDRERLANLAETAPAPAAAPEPVVAAPVPEPPVQVPPADPAPAADRAVGGKFMEGLDIREQKRRRAGLVEVCYRQRILKPRLPSLSMKQLEDGLELPVDQIEGPLWYLKETDLIRVSDAGNYAITVRGMNAIEAGKISFSECRFDVDGIV